MVYPAKLTASHLDAVRAQAPARQFFAPQGRVYVFEDEGLKRINIVGRYVCLLPTLIGLQVVL